MSNHLGNVLEVVSDRKLPVNDGNGNIDYFLADVVSYSDYYPGGMIMPGRSFNESEYRYGAANGQEKVDEISGSGNHYTAEYWEYDPRVVQRWNTDPVVKEWESPYACFNNNPILRVDPNGDNAGDYYSKDGEHLGSDGIDDNKAYVADGKNADGTFANAKELSVSHSTLKDFAATIHGESSGDKNESFAIGSTVVNYMNSSGKSLSSLVSKENNYSYAAGKHNYDNISNKGSKYEMAAAINALTGGFDYSLGATHWDGRDLMIDGTSHYRFRKAAFDSRQGIHIPSDKKIFVQNYVLGVMSHLANKNYYGQLENVLNNDIFHNDWNNNFSLGGYKEDALWEVTSGFGNSLFFKMLPTGNQKGRTTNYSYKSEYFEIYQAVFIYNWHNRKK